MKRALRIEFERESVSAAASADGLSARVRTRKSEPRLSASPPAPVAECQTYTVDEAAKILGISRNCAYDAVRRGEIPAIRLGRRLVVARKALELLLVGAPPDSR